ncbi:McrC family protein [candidate division KSB1 bacterium]
MNHNRRKSIKVFEHQVLKVGDEGSFKEKHFLTLEKYAYRHNEKYFVIGNKRIKFNNYVGVIQVRDLTIEVLPKADFNEKTEENKNKWHDALITILRKCKLIKIDSITDAYLKLKSASILDLYFDAFLSEIEGLVKQGLSKKYRAVESNLNTLKGKLLFAEHINRNLVHKEKFYVEHKIYDIDNLLNQILLKGIIILSNIASNPNFSVRIKRLLLNFENVSDTLITSKSFEKLTLSRNTERYKRALELAKLIILKYSPDLKGGNENVLAILFDMNRLFEEYIFRELKLQQNNYQIKVKKQIRKPFWETRGIRPDILIETKCGNFIIDTKWKLIKGNCPSDDDLKQMFTYNLHYDSTLSILLYPKTKYNDCDKKPFKDDRFNTYYCKLAFTDLFDENAKLINDLGEKLYNQLLKEEIVDNKCVN